MCNLHSQLEIAKLLINSICINWRPSIEYVRTRGEGRGSTGSVRTYLKFVFNVLRNKQDSEIDEEIALLKCDFILIQIMRVSIRNFISYT